MLFCSQDFVLIRGRAVFFYSFYHFIFKYHSWCEGGRAHSCVTKKNSWIFETVLPPIELAGSPMGYHRGIRNITINRYHAFDIVIYICNIFNLYDKQFNNIEYGVESGNDNYTFCKNPETLVYKHLIICFWLKCGREAGILAPEIPRPVYLRARSALIVISFEPFENHVR